MAFYDLDSKTRRAIALSAVNGSRGIKIPARRSLGAIVQRVPASDRR